MDPESCQGIRGEKELTMDPISIGAITGGIGSMIGGIGSMFGGGGKGYAQLPAGDRLHDIIERGAYGDLPYFTGKDLKTAWMTGQLPLPLQRSLQALAPLMQMKYSGATDQMALGANAAREDVARRYGLSGVTGPQLTAALNDIDLKMRYGDLGAMREAASGYAGALAGAYSDVYNRSFSEPAAYMGLGMSGGGGGGYDPSRYFTGASNIMSSIGRGLADYGATRSMLPSVPDYSGMLQGQGYAWSPSLGNTSFGQPYQPPSVSGGYTLPKPPILP